jgi:hypothetical protein
MARYTCTEDRRVTRQLLAHKNWKIARYLVIEVEETLNFAEQAEVFEAIHIELAPKDVGAGIGGKLVDE